MASHTIFIVLSLEDSLTISTKTSLLEVRSHQLTVQCESHVSTCYRSGVIIFRFKLELVFYFTDYSLDFFTIHLLKLYNKMCGSTFVL